MKRGNGVLITVLALLSFPLLLAAIGAASYNRANRSNHSLVSSGMRRDYLLYVPQSYDPARPTPLVLSFHGAGLWGAGQKEISRWNEVADREGIIVVYPSGVKDGGPRIWRVQNGPQLMEDVRFVAALIDTISASYNIDRARIYANGLCNGGGMSFVLSCTLSDRIAAVGLVAAAHTLPWTWCADRRPVPMISFHGTADTQTPYKGGVSWIAPSAFPDIATWAANWARRNRCDGTPRDSVIAPDVVRAEYVSCAGDAGVVLYTIRGGGHTWPGGGPLPEWFVGRTSTSIDATAVMWEFFREHPLSTAWR